LRFAGSYNGQTDLGHVSASVLDEVFIKLPSPPFTPEEKKLVADNIYAHVWQQAMRGGFGRAA
jgi:type I restriction enzyme R subunit